MSHHGPSFRLRPWLVVLIAGLFVAIALPAEPGAGQTPPPPAPDPVPDANPNEPPTGGSGGGGGTGGSTGGTGGSGGGDSSGSSSGSPGASSPPVSGGNESSSNSGDGQQEEAEAQAEARAISEPKRQKQDVDKPDVQATAASEARDPPARPAGLAPDGGAQPNVSANLELFVLALAGALTVVLLLLAATPPRVLAGVSVTLAQRQRKVELGLAAVLLSLIFGLLAAQCGANLR